MPKRTCDACGKEKDVSGGKTCENGHFVCNSCCNMGAFSSSRSTCPLCKKSLKQGYGTCGTKFFSHFVCQSRKFSKM